MGCVFLSVPTNNPIRIIWLPVFLHTVTLKTCSFFKTKVLANFSASHEIEKDQDIKTCFPSLNGYVGILLTLNS